MAVRKNKDLTFTVNEKTAEFGDVNTDFYTEDKGNASFRIRLKYENSYINLEEVNLRPQLDLFHSDGSIWMDEDLINILPKYGLIQYSVPDNVIRHKGKVQAKLFLKSNNKSIHVANFNFDIKDSGIEDVVEKEVTLTLLKETLIEIMQENSLGILDEEFKENLLTNIQNYLTENPETFKGEQGIQGTQGIQGEKGDRGDRGNAFTYDDFTSSQLNSLKGAKGDMGPQGIQGVKGEKGDQGEQGETGEQGIQGEKGDTGEPGEDGIDGTNGIDGVNPNKQDVIDEIKTQENKVGFDSVSLDTLLNAKVPLQSFIYTDKYIYALRLEPTPTRVQQDTTIMQFSKSGTYISSMKALSTDHIENVGYKDGKMYFVLFSANGANKALCRFNYVKDATVSYETTNSGNFERLSLTLDSAISHVNVSIYNNTLSLAYYKGVTSGIKLVQYTLSTLTLNRTVDLINGVDLNWLQGLAATDEHMYTLVGDYTYGNTKYIKKYNIATGVEEQSIDIGNIGADDTGANPMLNWLEPEGLQIYQENGKDIIMHGVFTGGTNTGATQKRFKIYRWNSVNQDNASLLSFYNHSDSMIYDGPSIQGNNTGTFSMIETAKNYKFLTFYYTAGVAGTHTVTVPTDLLKLVNYVDLECRAITANSELYNYITRIAFESDLKRFSITNSRMLKVNIATPASSSTTSNNYAGFYLYKIKGHQMYSEFDL